MPSKKKGNNAAKGNTNTRKKQQSQPPQNQKVMTTVGGNTADRAVPHPKGDTNGASMEADENGAIHLEALSELGLGEEDVTRIDNGLTHGDLSIAQVIPNTHQQEGINDTRDQSSAKGTDITDSVLMESFIAKLGEKLSSQDWNTPPLRPLCDGVTPSQQLANGAVMNAGNSNTTSNRDTVVSDKDTNLKVPTAEQMISFITAMFEDKEKIESSKQRGAALDIIGNKSPNIMSEMELITRTAANAAANSAIAAANSAIAASSGKGGDNLKQDCDSSSPQDPVSNLNKLIETLPMYNRQAMAKLFTDSTAAKRKKIRDGAATSANKKSNGTMKQGESDDKLTIYDESASDNIPFYSSEDGNQMIPTRQTITVDVSASSNNEGKISPGGNCSLSSSFLDLDDEEDLSGTTGSSIMTDGSDDADDSHGMGTEHCIPAWGIPQVDLDQMIYMIEKLSNLSLCTVKSICDQWGIGKEASVAAAAATTGNTEELKSKASWVPLFHHALERQQNQPLLRSGQSVRNKQLKAASRKEDQENQLHNLYYRSTIVQHMRYLSATIVICHADKCNLLKGTNTPNDRSKIVDDFVLTLWCRILNLDTRTRSSFSDILGFTEPDPSGDDMCIVVMAAGIAAMLSPLPIPLLQTICSEIGGHCRGSNASLIDPTLSEGDPDFLHELPVIRLCQEFYPRLDEIPVSLNAILHLSVPTVHENGPGSYTCTIDSAMIMTLIPKQTQVTNNFSCMNNVFNPDSKERVRWRAQIVVRDGAAKAGGEEASRLCFHLWHHSPHTHKIHLSVRSKGATAPSVNNKGKKPLINTPSGNCTNNAVVNAFNANTGSGIGVCGTGPLYASHTFLVEPNAVVGFSNLVPIDVVFNQLPGHNAPKGNGGANNNGLRLYSIHDDRISFQFNMEITETIPAKIPILPESDQQKLKRIHEQTEDREDARERKAAREIIAPVGKGGKKHQQEAGETIRDLIAEEQRYEQLAKEQKQKNKEEKKFKALETQTEPKARDKITHQYESSQQNIDIEIKRSWEKCVAKKKESERRGMAKLEKPNDSLIAELSALQQSTHANRTHVTKLSQDKNKVVKDLQKVTSQLEQRSKELEQLKQRFDVQSKELEVIDEAIELTRIRIAKKKKIVQQQKDAAQHSAHMNAFSTATPSNTPQQLTAARPPQPLNPLSNNTKGGKKPIAQQRVAAGGKGGHTMPTPASQSAQGRGPPPSVMTSTSTYHSNKTSASTSNQEHPRTSSHPVDSKADVDQFWETAKKDPVALTSPTSTDLLGGSLGANPSIASRIQSGGASDSGSFAVVSSGDITSPNAHAGSLFTSSTTTGGGLGSFSITSSNVPGGSTSNNNAASMIFSSATGGSSQQGSSNPVTPAPPLNNNAAHFYHGGSSNATNCGGGTASKGGGNMYSESNMSYLVRDEQQNGSSSTPFSTNPSASSNMSALHLSGSSSTPFVPGGGSKFSGLSFSTRAGASNGGGSSNIGNPFSTVGRHSPHQPPPLPPPLAGSTGGSFYLYGSNGMMGRGGGMPHGSGSPPGSYSNDYSNGSISRGGGGGHHSPNHNNNVGSFYGSGGNGYSQGGNGASYSSMGPGAVGQGEQGSNGGNVNGTSSRTPTPSFQITANAVNIENMFSGSGSNGSW